MTVGSWKKNGSHSRLYDMVVRHGFIARVNRLEGDEVTGRRWNECGECGAEWLSTGDYSYLFREDVVLSECDNCGASWDGSEGVNHYLYCPNCGFLLDWS